MQVQDRNQDQFFDFKTILLSTLILVLGHSGFAETMISVEVIGLNTVQNMNDFPLKVKINDSNEKRILINGIVTLVTSSPIMGNYRVTISGQPTRQFCTISNGSGNISVTNPQLTNPTIRCQQATAAPQFIKVNVTGLLMHQEIGRAPLKVAINGVDELSIIENGIQQFTTPFSNGQTYNIVMTAQPYGHTCTISNPSGTVTAAQVIAPVSCTPNSYNVGGNVTGLTGTLIIQNGPLSEQQTLIGSTRAYNFEVNFMSNYNITIVRNPEGQICTISNGSGTVSTAANVTNINITCTEERFKVGGTLTGLLTGGSITLSLSYLNGQIQSTESIQRTVNGRYQFNSLVSSGTIIINIESQPLSHSCLFANQLTNTNPFIRADYLTADITCRVDAVSLSGVPSPEGQVDRPYEFTPISNRSGLPFLIENKPNWATFNPATGRLSGFPNSSRAFSNIKITSTDSVTTGTIGPFVINVLGDPLVASSWHLNNIGQRTFARNPGIAGKDLNVLPVIKSGLTGKGVRIMISDEGLEINHEDLRDNVIPGASKNYLHNGRSSNDPTNDSLTDDHGTSVAGIAAMRGWNGKGSRGIAPWASIAGNNYLQNQNLPNRLDQAQGDFDIINQSWATLDRSYLPIDSSYLDILKSGVNTLRMGKGIIYVKCAGNAFLLNKNSAIDPEHTIPYVIVVGALNASGQHSSYSSQCACLWVSGLGGETGVDNAGFTRNFIPGNLRLSMSSLPDVFLPSSTVFPGILTTDSSTCDKGYSRKDLVTNIRWLGDKISYKDYNNYFNSLFNFDVSLRPLGRAHSQNRSCNYTSTFNGTSAAAPSISGVIALMLEANPSLTWREVKDILASTSTEISPGPGWIHNSAGYHFNNLYGFGRANAELAVNVARNYSFSTRMPRYRETAGNTDGIPWAYDTTLISRNIPDNNLMGISTTFNVTEDWKTEQIQISINIQHPNPSNLEISIISPSGTQSIVLDRNSERPINIIGGNVPNLTNVIFLSNAFYRELSRGIWTVKVADHTRGEIGKIRNIKLKLYGHQ